MKPTPTGLAPSTVSLPDGSVASRPARIGVVRNPRSHRNRGAVAHDPIDPDIAITAPASRDELARTLARFAEQGIGLLVVDGGDGTMREIMTAGVPVFGDAWPDILLLPKGKTNALAIDLSMPGKCSLADALRAAPTARRLPRRPLLLEREDEAGHQPVLGFILGAGMFNASIAAGQVAHRFGAFQGFAVAVTVLASIVQALFGVGRSPWRALYGMRIATSDAGEVARSRHGEPGHRYAAGFSTLGRFPVGLQPFADMPGPIRYIAVDAPLRRVIALVPAILFGMDRPFLRNLGVFRGSASDIALDLDGRFILDGESFPPGRYRLRQGPELTFLVP